MQSSSLVLALVLATCSLLFGLNLAAPNHPAAAPHVPNKPAAANDDDDDGTIGHELHLPGEEDEPVVGHELHNNNNREGEEGESTITVHFHLNGEEEEEQRMAEVVTEEEDRCCFNDCQSACAGKDNANYTCTCHNFFGCVCGSYSCATFG